MPSLSQPDQDFIAGMQGKLATIKATMASLETDCQTARGMAVAAGNAKAANAAMRLKGAITELRGGVIKAHSDVSDALLAAYDNAGPIVLGGGGGR